VVAALMMAESLAWFGAGLLLWLGPLVAAGRRRPRSTWLFGVAVVWALLAAGPVLLVDVVPQGAFLATWIRCGREPAIASNFAAGDWYDLPGDMDYGPTLFSSGFYCTAADAERAGYHRGLGPAPR
jgi:hypothetical protein